MHVTILVVVPITQLLTLAPVATILLHVQRLDKPLSGQVLGLFRGRGTSDIVNTPRLSPVCLPPWHDPILHLSLSSFPSYPPSLCCSQYSPFHADIVCVLFILSMAWLGQALLPGVVMSSCLLAISICPLDLYFWVPFLV